METRRRGRDVDVPRRRVAATPRPRRRRLLRTRPRRVPSRYTGREKIIKFEGCYHGHADGFLVQAGSGVATLGLPDSPGVPPGATAGTLVAEYNNLASVEELLKAHECAAVVLEPVVGNSGFIPPTQEFLEGLRALTTQHGRRRGYVSDVSRRRRGWDADMSPMHRGGAAAGTRIRL